MRFQFIAVTAGVTLGIVAGVTPLEAKVSVKPKASVARAVRAPPQPEAPPIGYCMKCLPPPYEWPHGGAGP
jgi:hypothetical protein